MLFCAYRTFIIKKIPIQLQFVLNASVALSVAALELALMQRIKQRLNVLPSRPTPDTVHPLLSSNLCGIKTSIGLLNINVCWTLNTFEAAQRRRIKEVPFKNLFFLQITGLKAASVLCSGHTAKCSLVHQYFLFKYKWRPL